MLEVSCVLVDGGRLAQPRLLGDAADRAAFWLAAVTGRS